MERNATLRVFFRCDPLCIIKLRKNFSYLLLLMQSKYMFLIYINNIVYIYFCTDINGRERETGQR